MIEGSLRSVPLSDVFQMLASGQKSGILTVIRGGSRARVYFEQSRIQHAHISPGIHLGEILVKLDYLSNREVQEILLTQTSENVDTPLGLTAVHKGLITHEELKEALEMQITEVVTELMLWRSGDFKFTERSNSSTQVLGDVRIDGMSLLISVTQRIQAWRDGSVDADTILERSGDPSKLTLPDGSWEILGLVDGSRTAESIAAELDLNERYVYRLLYELAERGVLRPTGYKLERPLVLVISASSAIQRLVRLALQRADLRAELFSSPDEALVFLESAHARALVIDEFADAWGFIREFRRLPGQGHLPIVLLVNEVQQGLFQRFRRPKAHVLEKPFHEFEFQQLIGRLVGRPVT